MIEKTFKTIKENPKVILVFLAAILLTTVGVLFISAGMLPQITLDQGTVGMVMPAFIVAYLQFLGLLILFMTLTSIFVWPSLGNYIYEMCSDKLEKGWYGRGLKRGWWKLLVLSIILIIGVSVLFFMTNLIFAVFMRSVFLSVGITLILSIAISVYYIIAATAVFAENSFAYALGNIFSIGSKYFFRLLGIVLLAYIPAFLISFISALAGFESVFTLQDVSVVSWILTAINTLYGVFLSVFILTYSMNSYLGERSIYYPEAVEAKDEADEVGEMP